MPLRPTRPSTLLGLAILTTLALVLAGCGTTSQLDRPSSPNVGGVLSGVLPEGQLATVIEVVDGDTIRVDRGRGVETVRYIGIDTPELNAPDGVPEPFAVEATEANAELVAGRQVVLERDVSETDRFGRLLRYVWLVDGETSVLVNDELVRRGLAEVRAYEPDTRYHEALSATRDEARAAGLGIHGP